MIRLTGVLWLGACLAMSYVMMGYDFKPGRLGPRRAGWPTETDYSYSTALIRNPNTPTVVAFVHPRCVCTKATITQLLRTVEAHPGAELVAAVFVPIDAKDRQVWEESAYVKTIRAAAPDACIVFDRGGVQAWRFGALTSGTILAYDAQGREIFRGGITDRRGGERDNPGVQRFALALGGDHASAQAEPTPVFGCPLVATTTEATAGGDR